MANYYIPYVQSPIKSLRFFISYAVVLYVSLTALITLARDFTPGSY